jgi:hypothetical protein
MHTLEVMDEGDSVREVRELRKKLSKNFTEKDMHKLNAWGNNLLAKLRRNSRKKVETAGRRLSQGKLSSVAAVRIIRKVLSEKREKDPSWRIEPAPAELRK